MIILKDAELIALKILDAASKDTSSKAVAVTSKKIHNVDNLCLTDGGCYPEDFLAIHSFCLD